MSEVRVLKDAVDKEIGFTGTSNADFFIDRFNGLLEKIKATHPKIVTDIDPVEKPTTKDDAPVEVGHLLRRISYYCDLIENRWPRPGPTVVSSSSRRR